MKWVCCGGRKTGLPAGWIDASRTGDVVGRPIVDRQSPNPEVADIGAGRAEDEALESDLVLVDGDLLPGPHECRTGVGGAVRYADYAASLGIEVEHLVGRRSIVGDDVLQPRALQPCRVFAFFFVGGSSPHRQ